MLFEPYENNLISKNIHEYLENKYKLYKNAVEPLNISNIKDLDNMMIDYSEHFYLDEKIKFSPSREVHYNNSNYIDYLQRLKYEKIKSNIKREFDEDEYKKTGKKGILIV